MGSAISGHRDRRSTAVLLVGLSCLAACRDAASVTVVDGRPNVLVLMSDDQPVGMLGCEGHPWSQTPALDRLAESGVRFSQACVTTALCSPSRASFLTGRYARSHGIVDNDTPFPLDLPTFATRMTAAGYDSAYVGKWHMGDQAGARPGFAWSATLVGQASYRQNTFLIGTEEELTETRVGGWVDDVSALHAQEFLRRERSAPFLLVVGFKGPHRPHRPARRHEQLYAGEPLELPDNADAYPPFPMHHELEALAERAGTDVAGYDPPEAWAEDWAKDFGGRAPEPWSGRVTLPTERMRDCYRVLHGVDENVGRILDVLEETGAYDSTLIVFTSDNGLGMGSHGMIGKHTCYEESVLVPLIVRLPGGRTGAVVDELVLNVDLAPTLLEVAGLPKDESMHGRSLVALLEGHMPEPAWRTHALLEVAHTESPLPPSTALRTPEWKLIRYPGRASWTELFHLPSDPGERTNLAQDAQYAQELEQWSARLDEAERALALPRVGR